MVLELNKSLASLGLAMALLVSPALAQAPVSIPESCVVVVQSMINIAEDKDTNGTTVEQATQYYLSYLMSQGVTQLHPVQNRIFAKIKEVHELNPLTPQTLEPLVEKELALCLKLKGDYSKLSGV